MKIYNGYRLTHGTDLANIPTELHDLLMPVYETELVRAAVALATGWFDRDTFKDVVGPPEDVNAEHGYLAAADLHIASAQSVTRKQQTRDPFFDLDVDVSLIPDPISGDWLAMLSAENKAYREAWNALDWVHDYPYWDTDSPPDGLTDEAWQERRVVWDRALGWATPQTVGFSWSLLGLYGGEFASHIAASDPDHAEALIPSVERRMQALTRLAAANHLTPLAEGEKFSVRNLISELETKIPAWAADLAWQERLATLRPLTIEDLTGRTPT